VTDEVNEINQTKFFTGTQNTWLLTEHVLCFDYQDFSVVFYIGSLYKMNFDINIPLKRHFENKIWKFVSKYKIANLHRRQH
jgi:hypothetical protein